MKLQGKTALITGAASGIGLATARLFAAEGARVMLTDRNDPSAAADSLGADPNRIGVATFDVTDASAVQRGVDQTLARFGQLDILVNNAGIDLAKSVPDTSEAEWDQVLGVNLKGVFLCARAAIVAMRRGGQGVIVNVASELGLVGNPNTAAYCASKGGVVLLTKAMAIDHAREGIRVNCICPGPIATPLLERVIAAAEVPSQIHDDIVAGTLLGRLGRADEIARSILFLAGDDSSYMTGATLTVDGGWTAR